MYKQLIVIIILFSIPYSISAQPGFSIAQGVGYFPIEFNDALVRNDTIVTYGLGRDSTNNWAQGVVLAKFDSSGNMLMSKIIVHPPGDWYSVDKHWGKIVGTSDGGYAMTTATYYSKKGVLIKTDRDFNVEFIAEYPDTINLSNYFYKLLETKDGYLLFGAIQRPDYQNDGFLRYVDKTGNTIWLKYLSFSPGSCNVMDVYATSDTTFLASINYALVSNSDKEGRFILLNVDKHGENSIVWHSNINDETTGALRKIVSQDSTGLLIYGLSIIEISPTQTKLQPTLSKFNNQYEVEWTNRFGFKASPSGDVSLWHFSSTPENNFIGFGETLVKEGNEPIRRVGWLYKFSPQGDSIWERKVNAPFLPLYFTNSGFFAGGGILSSGNVIAAGTCNEGNTNYAWLVKVSSDGCMDTFFCQPSAVSDVFSKAGKITAYPNPSRGEFTVELPPLAENLAIFDAYGRLAHAQNIERGTLTTNLRLNLHPGVYSLVVGGNGLHQVGKVVVVE